MSTYPFACVPWLCRGNSKHHHVPTPTPQLTPSKKETKICTVSTHKGVASGASRKGKHSKSMLKELPTTTTCKLTTCMVTEMITTKT